MDVDIWKEESTESGPGIVEVFISAKPVFTNRNTTDETLNDLFNYVEESFVDEVKILFSNLFYWEGMVHIENTSNLRRHTRNVVLKLLNDSDDQRRRLRLSSSPPCSRKLPNMLYEYEREDFISEVQAQAEDLLARNIEVNKKNLGIKRHIEKLRKRIETDGFKNATDREDALELVADYDINPLAGDVIENPWKSLAQDFKKYDLTIDEIKSKLNQKP